MMDLTPLMIPDEWLDVLRTASGTVSLYHLAGLHAPLRLMHLCTMAIFFGTIVALDLRLLGALAGDMPVATVSRILLPITHRSFVLACASGIVLFAYDPIAVGHGRWFVLKLLLVGAAVVNAAAFSLPRNRGLRAVDRARGRSRWAPLAGAVSVMLWAGVIACATANHEQRRPAVPTQLARAR